MNKIDSYEEAKRRIQQALEQNADHLWLDSLGLSDLPPELGELTSITYLNLEDNRLKTLPEVILQLIQLQELDVEGNPLYTLPDQIGKLQQLQNFNIHECQLVELRESFGELVNLTGLSLFGNQLQTLPASFCNLTKLEHLTLAVNHFETLPENFGNLVNLTSLSAGGNQIRELPESFTDLARLEYLDLCGNQLMKLPVDFHKLTGLMTMDISQNPIIALPEMMPVLEILNISHCKQITELPLTLQVTDSLMLAGQRLSHLPEGCKKAKLQWHSNEFEERIIFHPETITGEEVAAAPNHFAREALLNLMSYHQLLHEVDMKIMDELNHDEYRLKLVKIEIPDGEAEIYLLIVDKQRKNHRVEWVLPKFQTCQEAFDWCNRRW